MSLRTKFFIIFGVVIAFIVFVVLVLTRGGEEAVDGNAPPSTSVQIEKKTVKGTTQPAAPKAEGKKTAKATTDALSYVRSFAERFGSFSSISNFENLEGLKPFMTPTMQAWADQYIAQARAKRKASDPYYGITTRALDYDMVQMNEDGGSAEAIVKTQRREVKGQENPRVFLQDISLTFRKVEGEWRVDGATWK